VQPVAHRAAQQLIHWNAERLRLDVDKGVFDGGDRLMVDAVWGLACQAMQKRSDFLDWPRIHANQPLAQSLNDATQALGAEIFQKLGPGDQAVVGGDLQERETRQPALQCRSSSLTMRMSIPFASQRC
jgi:hypothetical protein